VPYSLILALASLAITLALTPLVMVLARRFGAVDRPGPRRVHREPVPTLGGLAMVVAVLGVAWGARLLPGPARVLDLVPLIGITVATVPVLALGILDDLRGTSPWIKLLCQGAAAVVLFRFGIGVPLLSNPFGEASLETGPFNLPLTVVWVVMVMNAINLIDGLDGLAAGVVFIASATLWWVGRSHGNFYVLFLTSTMIGTTLGFLRYNFPPARVFMGDTGSQFLGLVLAAASLLDNRKVTATVSLLFPLVALAVPLADSAIAFARRLFHGQPVFGADSEHIHHRLLRLGLSQRDAVLVLWFVAGYSGVMAVILSKLPPSYALLLSVVLGAGLFFAFEVLRFVDRKLIARRAAGENVDEA
jgi:UDP-GlcNAc:undecaprenyl-phosphate GlcNAc-1-phosphate transferase